MESSSLFRQDGQQGILFSKLSDGATPAMGASIELAYQSLGVTFSFGAVERHENVRTSPCADHNQD